MHSENEKVAAGRTMLADHILGQRAIVRQSARLAADPTPGEDPFVLSERLRLAKQHLWSLRVIAATFTGNPREIPFPR